MVYRVQIFYSEAGLYINTNHTSENLEPLKALVASEVFDGFKYRIIDEHGNDVGVECKPRERKKELTIDDIARSLDVPVLRPIEGLNFDRFDLESP